jgi:ribonuclease inhibitor
MKAEIDGTRILTEADFHREIASALNFSAYYGRNLNALWDTLSTDVARPVQLIWHNARKSELAMPEKFKEIVNVLQAVVKQDTSFGWDDRFEFILD